MIRVLARVALAFLVLLAIVLVLLYAAIAEIANKTRYRNLQGIAIYNPPLSTSL